MLEEKIMKDYQEALRSRDSLKSSVLSFLRADIMNTALAKKKDKLDDTDIVAVVRKQIKSRQDSIEQFTKGSRQDLADKEQKELAILKEYLPQELSADQIAKIIQEVIVATGAKDIKDMGKVMKEVTVKIAGKADPKLVSDLVRQKLQAQSS